MSEAWRFENNPSRRGRWLLLVALLMLTLAFVHPHADEFTCIEGRAAVADLGDGVMNLRLISISGPRTLQFASQFTQVSEAPPDAGRPRGGVEFHQAGPGDLLAAEGEQLPRQAGAPFAGVFDLPEPCQDRIVLLAALFLAVNPLLGADRPGAPGRRNPASGPPGSTASRRAPRSGRSGRRVRPPRAPAPGPSWTSASRNTWRRRRACPLTQSMQPPSNSCRLPPLSSRADRN